MSAFAKVVLVTVGSVALLCTASAAHADTINGNIFNNTLYEQTSDTQPTIPSGFFFNISADFATPGAFISGSVTYPGVGSPQVLSPFGSTSVTLGSPLFNTLADLHAAFPFGTYTITADGPGGSQTSVINYAADFFESSTIPFVTNYDALNGLNPSADFTVDYPSFTPDPNTTPGDQFTFFTIFDHLTGTVAFSSDFQSPSSIGALIAAGTLAPNTIYDFELDYSNRIDGSDIPDGTTTEQGFDVRTDGSFTTGAVAVPEPASLVLIGGALTGFGLIRRGRRAAAAKRAST